MPVVDTARGRLKGQRAGDAVAFRGIAYATAPRFAPSRAIESWAGVREAITPGPPAPQPKRPAALFTHGELPATDEDCLNLNVFTTDLEAQKPVFVWLHGGGFAVGYAGASLYAGERLAVNADAVVVTVNHRLGSLGWLAHPDLAATDDAPAANWGLLDQIAALEWVQENIASFGGDPRRVTLAGQSAGALSAMDLLVAPAANGLFRRTVIQSPPIGDIAQPTSAGARWAEALSAAAGGETAFDAKRLRDLDADRIVDLHEALLEQPAFRGTRGGALPTLDKASLPASPVDAPEASPEVDVLIGHTAQEGTFFFRSPWRPAPPPERARDIVAHLCPDQDPDEVLRLNGGDLVEIATDAMVAGPLERWASARADALGFDAAVYRYRVDHPGAGAELAATHTVEVPLLFGTWTDGGPGQRLAGQAPGADEVSRAIVTAWSAFIHGGTPGWSAQDVGVFGGPAAFGIDARQPALTE